MMARVVAECSKRHFAGQQDTCPHLWAARDRRLYQHFDVGQRHVHGGARLCLRAAQRASPTSRHAVHQRPLKVVAGAADSSDPEVCSAHARSGRSGVLLFCSSLLAVQAAVPPDYLNPDGYLDATLVNRSSRARGAGRGGPRAGKQDLRSHSRRPSVPPPGVPTATPQRTLTWTLACDSNWKVPCCAMVWVHPSWSR
jgi:hypothetical protein